MQESDMRRTGYGRSVLPKASSENSALRGGRELAQVVRHEMATIPRVVSGGQSALLRVPEDRFVDPGDGSGSHYSAPRQR